MKCFGRNGDYLQNLKNRRHIHTQKKITNIKNN